VVSAASMLPVAALILPRRAETRLALVSAAVRAGVAVLEAALAAMIRANLGGVIGLDGLDTGCG
jgi:hypothetical protein